MKFAAERNISLEEAQAERQKQHPAQRFGEPSEFGHTAAFLCSVHAGYITGQNIVMDGGQYPGTL